MTETLRCWWCDVEPDDVVELVQFGGQVVKLIPNWPPGDHVHAATPPSADQLLDSVLLRPAGPLAAKPSDDLWMSTETIGGLTPWEKRVYYPLLAVISVCGAVGIGWALWRLTVLAVAS